MVTILAASPAVAHAAFTPAAIGGVRPAPAAVGPFAVGQPRAIDRPAQGVDYRIEARLDERRQVLDARLQLTYTNRSPDTLDRLYLHLHLNAFRPNSRWARTERRPGLDFQSLEDPHHAFERLGRVEIDGSAVVPLYPYAPDSTVVELPLSRPLPPGGIAVVRADWRARPATLPRRQGRAGRHWDFAQWYPRIAVYDRFGWQAHPLYPQGEFYGEFASYDVTLEVLADQVLGATGLPVSGDPGWRAPGSPVTYLRDHYGAPREWRAGGADGGGADGRSEGRARESLGLLGPRPAPGFKRVRWRAEDVHHFAWSADPAFRYEEGRYGDVVIRALYRPEEAEDWSGTAVEHVRRALAFFDTVFGLYAWPQLTVLRRIEGGGTEFPMLVMQGDASEGLTVHEVAHEYVHGILANNEWKEGWLDEGFATFLTAWYMDRRYGPYGSDDPPAGHRPPAPRLTRWEAAELEVLALDLNGRSQPVSTVSEDFTEFSIYNSMIYRKGSLILRMLRYVIGEDRFRELLRTYYARYRLRHVDEDAFRETAEDVCGCDLNWFFGQWLHATPLIDYELGRVRTRAAADGEGYVTRGEVVRNEDGVMPVEVAVTDSDGREHRVRVAGRARSEMVEVRTSSEPRDVALDPDGRILDWNPTNDRGRPSPLRIRPAWNMPDWPFFEPVRRDGLVREWLPLIWYNDADHAVLGLRARENLMGWLAAHEFGLAIGVAEPQEPHVWMRLRNPTWWRAPRQTRELSIWRVESRAGASVRIEKDVSPRLRYASERSWSIGLQVMDADADGDRLPPARWTPATTAELRLGYSEARDHAGGRGRLELAAALGGYGYDGTPPGREPSGGYARGTAELRWTKGEAAGPFLGSRLFAGGIAGTDALVPEQRRLYVAGAGPYEVFWNPLLRSRGSLFRRGDVRYFAPGEGGLRGYRPELGGRWLVTALGRAGLRTAAPGNTTVELSGFAEAGVVDGSRVQGPAAPEALWLFDAGPGVRLRHGVLDGVLEVGADFPVYVRRPALAADARDGEWGFRWAVTLGASF